MKRILFVDDEPEVLSGLRLLLRRRRREWNMQFCSSAAAALDALSQEPCDAIVTDLIMPVTDGVALLTAVRERHPAVIRVVLSGSVESERALLAARLAHRCLAKPCPPEVLQEQLGRTLAVAERLGPGGALAAVAGVDLLPLVPTQCRRLAAVLEEAGNDAADVAVAVSGDPGLCAKLLQLVNSPYFDARAEVTDLSRAATLVGARALRSLARAARDSCALDAPSDRLVEHMEAVALRAGQTAELAASRFSDRASAAEAYSTALLCDIGQFVMAAAAPDDMEAILREVDRRGATFEQVERELGLPGHETVGAWLLELWGLPGRIVRAVATHHAGAGVGDWGHGESRSAAEV